MKQHLEQLWAEIYPTAGPCPAVDPDRIRQRVHAALEAVPSERRTPMRKKFRMALVLAAVLAALAGTALAVVYHYHTALEYFDGDTAPLESAVQAVDETLENDSYRVHVDSVLSDSHSTVLGLSIEALNEEAQAALMETRFMPLSILHLEAEQTDSSTISFSFTSEQAEASVRRFSLRLEGAGAPNTLRLSLVGAPEDSGLTLPLETALAGRSVQSTAPLDDGREHVIRSCTLNPTGIELEVEFAAPVRGDRIAEFCFRMVDGSLKTLSQWNGAPLWLNSSHIPTEDGSIRYRYWATFRTLLDPQEVAGVLLNGMEYSFLDPDRAVPAEIPETLRPFLTPFVERGEHFYFSAQDAFRRLGASLEQEDERFVIRYLNHTLCLTPNETAARLDGKPIILSVPPLQEGENLLLIRECLQLLGLDCRMYYPEAGQPVHAPDDWVVSP